MTVRELSLSLSFSPLCLPNPQKEVTGGYTGDLLSWVMSGAKEGDAWVTIMSNINVVAVASLCDVSCVILAQGVTLGEKELETAKEKGVNVVCSQMTAFEVCRRIGAILR